MGILAGFTLFDGTSEVLVRGADAACLVHLRPRRWTDQHPNRAQVEIPSAFPGFHPSV